MFYLKTIKAKISAIIIPIKSANKAAPNVCLHFVILIEEKYKAIT